MNQKERMQKGLPYKPWLDGLEDERELCKMKIHELNHLYGADRDRIPEIMESLFGKVGENCWLEPPFHCDYGYNIEIGDNFFGNYNLMILDIGKVKIGANAQIAPNVAIYSVGHPIHPEMRNSGYEAGEPVTIGDNVWIGGNSVILSGVTIGDNVVIGAGSVVSKDLPDNVVAVGNPCRVIREITEEDRVYYLKKKKFDQESWEDIMGTGTFMP
ncbi:MAG: sugar O-acetyltransferase [Hespellia sp.]|jgi:maltose O-acetyltransferase|nr:sugar O-acetyltransferase [Hespellia sp.]